MKLVEFSTDRRITVAMLMVAVVAFGLIGFDRLAVNLLPDITYPTITVRTEYAGVAPAEIERLVAEPIEGRLLARRNVLLIAFAIELPMPPMLLMQPRRHVSGAAQ